MKDGAVTLTSTLRAPPRMQQHHRAGSSPEEKKRTKTNNITRTSTGGGEQNKELASSNATVSAAARGPLSAIAAALPVALPVTREPSFISIVTSIGSSTEAAFVAVALAT